MQSEVSLGMCQASDVTSDRRYSLNNTTEPEHL